MHLKYLHYFGNESNESLLEAYGIIDTGIQHCRVDKLRTDLTVLFYAITVTFSFQAYMLSFKVNHFGFGIKQRIQQGTCTVNVFAASTI
jgi:hypothetical protein